MNAIISDKRIIHSHQSIWFRYTELIFLFLYLKALMWSEIKTIDGVKSKPNNGIRLIYYLGTTLIILIDHQWIYDHHFVVLILRFYALPSYSSHLSRSHQQVTKFHNKYIPWCIIFWTDNFQSAFYTNKISHFFYRNICTIKTLSIKILL